MTKLLNKYLAEPTLENAQAIRAYDKKHPFAACLLFDADAALLAKAIRHADRG